MKKVLNILAIFYFLGELLEHLAIPAVFVLLGIVNDLPWQYYLITVGGYCILLFGTMGILHLIFRSLGKRYTPHLVKTFGKITKDSKVLPQEDN